MGQVRITAESEAMVRALAKQMGVTIQTVKGRGDCWQGYGIVQQK